MSSHHFVKDGQEPALLIADPVFDDALSALLEWAPYIAVSSNSVQKLISAGTKIDVVILERTEDQDHVRGLLTDQGAVTLIVPADDESTVAAGLEYLISKREAGVNILSASPEIIFEEAQPFAGRIQISVFAGGIKWSLIDRRTFEKWFPGGSLLQVRKDKSAQNIEFQGLRQSNGVLEVITSGLVRIASERQFWIGEAY